MEQVRISFRQISPEDTGDVLSMMKDFYASPALIYHAGEDVLRRDIEACLSPNPFVECIVFECCDTGKLAGYSILAHSYSAEYGMPCMWIEDLYIRPEYCSKGIGMAFFEMLDERYRSGPVRFRLEAEPENTQAMALYKRCGYKILEYTQMNRVNKAGEEMLK
ncbi:MAG: N-acetyltransferase [Clostridiales bacterium]|nr:N-acetyltransferase [Clostridiales bacterium]